MLSFPGGSCVFTLSPGEQFQTWLDVDGPPDYVTGETALWKVDYYTFDGDDYSLRLRATSAGYIATERPLPDSGRYASEVRLPAYQMIKMLPRMVLRPWIPPTQLWFRLYQYLTVYEDDVADVFDNYVLKDIKEKSMWLTILMSLLSYFATSRATGGDKQKAALGAIIGGLGTATVVSTTDWGQNAASSFDSALGITSDPLLKQQVQNQTNAAAAGGTKTSTTTTVPGTSVWDTIKSWTSSGAGLVAAGAAGAVGAWSLADFLKKWAPWLIGGALVYIAVSD